ncbi:MAG TPA: RDD family protein [Acidimicrobiales bacterium]|nr:RDD family protein [Acidimicrobiales bacterium]
MSLEDRYVLTTPEGVSLDAVLAGLGSRLAAFSLDFLIQSAFFVVVAIAVAEILSGGGETSALVAAGVLSLVALLDFIGYFVVCEMLWSGRSVGKRAAGTRVVRVGGAPIGFWSSLLRNVTRLVDMFPAPLYLVGSVLVLATPRNQRLGDLLGGTVVIRDRQAATALQRGMPFDDPRHWAAPYATAPYATAPYGTGVAGALPPELAHWDVSAVGEHDLALVRTFLANRSGYTPQARQRLALQLADRLWPLVAGPVTAPHPEQFLEAVTLVKSVRR